ncbi:hypothetical protein PG997_014353 [Apiospora hydei]|uniref:Uncharacterized protein n=1 Tax=Apiospora hydei TaxID=1337664 RepID=A0ABR1UW10_9PEZI
MEGWYMVTSSVPNHLMMRLRYRAQRQPISGCRNTREGGPKMVPMHAAMAMLRHGILYVHEVAPCKV